MQHAFGSDPGMLTARLHGQSFLTSGESHRWNGLLMAVLNALGGSLELWHVYTLV